MSKFNFNSSRWKNQFNESRQHIKSVKWTPYVLFNSIYKVLANIVMIMLVAGVLLASLLGGFGVGYFAALVKDEPVPTKKELTHSLHSMNQSSTVYFASGESLGSLNADVQRTTIKYDQVSPHVVDALISTEDENFYHHNGIVPKAFIRASAQEFLGSASTSGGSTLTQQLVKNQLLSNETSFERKAKEMLLSFRVEKTLTKKQILEAYLNVVSFGRNTNGKNIAGIEAAAQGVFGKKAKDLNIAQSAYLAGMPQNPYTYTPFKITGQVKNDEDLQYGFARQKYVLERMKAENKISEKEYNEAIKFDLKKSFIDKVSVPDVEYPFLTKEIENRAVQILKYEFAKKDKVSKQELDETPILNEKYTAMADDEVRNSGYTIQTTINKPIFDKMNEIKSNPYYYSYDRQADVDGQMTNLQQEVGVMLKENTTGKIIAFVGGRDYEKSQNNHATQTKRSPGSTMKPLVAYAPAIEYGVTTPESMLLDKRFSVNGYSPENYARAEFGQVTTRLALMNSLNLSTLRLYSGIQDRKPWEFLDKMHIDIPENQKPNLSLPLGATDMTLEDNVNGFSTFANNGDYQESYMIESIKKSNGEVIYKHEAKPEPVFSDATSYIMTDMLRGVLDTGSAYQLKGTFQYNQDWAGKTGTAENGTDSLFIAYNPKVTLGIWMGYDKLIPFDEENHYQLKLWRDINNSITAINPGQMGVNQTFSQPASVQKTKICQITNSNGSCSSGESSADSLVWKQSDLSSKTIDDSRVLGRLGINIDGGTRSKINPKQNIADNIIELKEQNKKTDNKQNAQ
ncbi:penicillin-binding protein [Macrococcus hajekii]|uniref:Penicillin-binding protein n=1 Tax=Macrococcus hajekii TaxID=198482 RepID=A0A4R6BLJ8_9STAP|nr:transglycosylase domain-containing protein [Macrococcus hajekii]TDM02673.1 penicillin-binding protein [Macrococcus hajekii]GGB02955.1 penicillin-binding protein 1B [Macrococcus hajekii]